VVDLKLDEAGAAALVRELGVHAADSDDHSRRADAALRAASGAVTSSPLAGAMGRFGARFRGRGDAVGARMTSLGSAVTTAAHAIVSADGDLASAIERSASERSAPGRSAK
jgi:hypothetical protein